MESTIHWSHSLVAFRHRNDERNTTDVTGRPAPVERKWVAKSRSKPGCSASGWTFLDEAGDSFQQRHLKENNDASTNEQPGNDPS